jgi:hypothetical protein
MDGLMNLLLMESVTNYLLLKKDGLKVGENLMAKKVL